VPTVSFTYRSRLFNANGNRIPSTRMQLVS
jgi:hypothetical protein